MLPSVRLICSSIGAPRVVFVPHRGRSGTSSASSFPVGRSAPSYSVQPAVVTGTHHRRFTCARKLAASSASRHSKSTPSSHASAIGACPIDFQQRCQRAHWISADVVGGRVEKITH
ncbi:hypothetical protein HYPSUDRAFT_89269 [Hypholoma sublateritium FD-334 SS-4]|uniref:Uncharacterized protein n=1 Tax=Hypholoma sublateritium (strain FD-334 SS-4) TaxID=945553 RepID=A0A0D2NLM6_HYPSF|nr:hypothetical protein HYPSUDRAFT_89269 [Hypholoma sublateritium FD-334 SS-4]